MANAFDASMEAAKRLLEKANDERLSEVQSTSNTDSVKRRKTESVKARGRPRKSKDIRIRRTVYIESNILHEFPEYLEAGETISDVVNRLLRKELKSRKKRQQPGARVSG